MPKHLLRLQLKVLGHLKPIKFQYRKIQATAQPINRVQLLWSEGISSSLCIKLKFTDSQPKLSAPVLLLFV